VLASVGQTYWPGGTENARPENDGQGKPKDWNLTDCKMADCRKMTDKLVLRFCPSFSGRAVHFQCSVRVYCIYSLIHSSVFARPKILANLWRRVGTLRDGKHCAGVYNTSSRGHWSRLRTCAALACLGGDRGSRARQRCRFVRPPAGTWVPPPPAPRRRRPRGGQMFFEPSPSGFVADRYASPIAIGHLSRRTPAPPQKKKNNDRGHVLLVRVGV